MASEVEAQRVAAASHLRQAAAVCVGVLQTSAHYGVLTTQSLLGTEAGRLPPQGALHWVWSATLHEMLQGVKACLFAAHVSQRMVDAGLDAAAATAELSVELLPDTLAHERWLRLPWLPPEPRQQGHAVLLALHRVRKCLHRHRGVVRAQEAGKQAPLVLQTLRLTVTPDESLQVRVAQREFKDGAPVVLSGDDLAAVGLTLWALVQQIADAFAGVDGSTD